MDGLEASLCGRGSSYDNSGLASGLISGDE